MLVVDRYVYMSYKAFTETIRRRKKLEWLIKPSPQPTVVFYIKLLLEVVYDRKGDIPALEFLYRSEEEKQELLRNCRQSGNRADGNADRAGANARRTQNCNRFGE